MRSRGKTYRNTGLTMCWIFPAVLAVGGVMLGLQVGDFLMMNRSSAVFLLAIAFVCIKDILA